MVSQTNEQALEAAIEKCLTGICLEELKTNNSNADVVREADVPFGEHHGYKLGFPADFNARYAIDAVKLWSFLETTQAEDLEKLQRSGSDWQRKVLERFDRMIKKYGLIHLLKKGLDIDDAHLNLMYPAPLASSSDSVKQHFDENIFSSTRQLRYSLSNTLEEIDMVLFINGLPTAIFHSRYCISGVAWCIWLWIRMRSI